MKVIFKAPGCLPEIRDIPNALSALQEAVGGHIELVKLSYDFALVCNEEGRILGLPYNCDVYGVPYVGPILLVGTREDDLCDIPPDLYCLFNFGGGHSD